MPLEERIRTGIGSFYATILKQKRLAREAAASAFGDTSGPFPPEIRLGAISQDRKVDIEFTNEMNFPSTEDFIALNTSKQNRLMNVMMLSGDEHMIDENLVSWSITSVSPTLISIDLVFDSPLSVSQGDTPDILVI